MTEDKNYPHLKDFMLFWADKIERSNGKVAPFTADQLDAISKYNKFLKQSLRLRVRSRMELTMKEEIELTEYS